MDVPDAAVLPRLPHFILERRRLLERCAPSKGVLKLLAAPAGFGKTILATQLAKLQAGRFAYIALCEEDDGHSVARYIAGALAAGRHLIIDDAHRASPSGREAVRAFLRTLDPAVEVLVCSRTSKDIVEPRSLFDGSTDVIDAAELAFTPTEIRALCSRFAVAFGDRTLEAFEHRTGCWPMAVSGALRVAGERTLSIAEAVDAWYHVHGSAVARFVADESLALAPGAGFLKHVRHPGPTSQEELQSWHDAGLFVGRDGPDYRVLPVIYGVFGNEPQIGSRVRAPLRMEMFSDDLRAAIGETRLRWVRHKDAQVVKYLVLRNASVTRSELMEIFWPGRERNIAAQNLRTTCSNIRRALREAVGADSVEHYFESGGNVRIGAPVQTDLEEFREQISLARRALAGGDSRRAREHFKKAREMYRTDLLTGMPACGFDDIAASLRADFGEAVHRLRTLPELARPQATAS